MTTTCPQHVINVGGGRRSTAGLFARCLLAPGSSRPPVERPIYNIVVV